MFHLNSARVMWDFKNRPHLNVLEVPVSTLIPNMKAPPLFLLDTSLSLWLEGLRPGNVTASIRATWGGTLLLHMSALDDQ